MDDNPSRDHVLPSSVWQYGLSRMLNYCAVVRHRRSAKQRRSIQTVHHRNRMLTGCPVLGLEGQLACKTKGRADPSRTVVYFRTPICVDHAGPVRFLIRLIFVVRQNMIRTPCA